MSPLVSVIMPLFNASEYLKDAMNSILMQNFSDFELIIIDDGSTDNSAEIAKSYKDTRIRYFYQTNSGVASALNFGLLVAKGEYIWRHDADDICDSTKLKLQLDFLLNHPEYSLCSTQIAFMTHSGKIAYDFRQPSSDYFEGKYYKRVVRIDFNPYSPITHATVLVKRSVLQELGGYREYFETAEDVDLWMRLIQKYSAAVINECNYFVRLSPTSATAVKSDKNEFYRNKAFEFYTQRTDFPFEDDLMAGNPVVKYIRLDHSLKMTKGFNLRNDLLYYKIPLYRNAGDWSMFWKAIAISLYDGGLLFASWKRIVIILLGTQLTDLIVKVKSKLR